MHLTTAKLITLERTEAFLARARGWPEGSQAAFAEQASALRQKIRPHILAAYDGLKTEDKEAVVGVFQEKCGGCHASPSQTALKRLSEETEISRCEHCGRFIYLAGGHNLAPSGNAHQLTGGHASR
jgi:predicted  nucleic acid-binding Zn-ribbon protein